MLMNAVCRYYVGSLAAAFTCERLIWASDDKNGATTVYAFVSTVVLVVALPCADALPARIISPRVQVGVFGCATATFAFYYIQQSMNTLSIYQNRNVPELKVDQYAQISALDILSKAWLTLCLLSLHLCYRSWRHSLQAVLAQEPISFADLPAEDAAERLFDAANAHNKRAKVGC